MLIMWNKLREQLRGLAGSRRDQSPGDLAIALGVPLVLFLLIGICGWPLSWSGATRNDVAPRVSPLPPEVPAQVVESSNTDAAAAPERPEPENPELRELREELAAARAAQLETAKLLASLRSQQESELESVQEQRDKLTLKLTELQSEITAMREAQARDAAMAKEERGRAEEKIRKLEEETKRLREECLKEKRRAAEVAEELRRALAQEAARRNPVPEQKSAGAP